MTECERGDNTPLNSPENVTKNSRRYTVSSEDITRLSRDTGIPRLTIEALNLSDSKLKDIFRAEAKKGAVRITLIVAGFAAALFSLETVTLGSIALDKAGPDTEIPGRVLGAFAMFGLGAAAVFSGVMVEYGLSPKQKIDMEIFDRLFKHDQGTSRKEGFPYICKLSKEIGMSEKRIYASGLSNSQLSDIWDNCTASEGREEVFKAAYSRLTKIASAQPSQAAESCLKNQMG